MISVITASMGGIAELANKSRIHCHTRNITELADLKFGLWEKGKFLSGRAHDTTPAPENRAKQVLNDLYASGDVLFFKFCQHNVEWKRPKENTILHIHPHGKISANSDTELCEQ